MKTPDLPANESQRLTALRNLRVLDTAPEEKLDRLTGLVKAHFKSSIALISMVDADRQWFKARLGLQIQETSRDVSFCGHAILSDEILWIEDATQDSRFAENPLVTGAPNIRFYAGAPLAIRPGLNLGTLCVIDTVPRPYSQADAKILGEFAKCVAEELSERRAVGILADAIEAIPEGFAIFDEDDRLFACNDAYRKIYAKSLPTIHKGALFKDIVRYGTEHGEYPEAGDTAADHTRWIDRCLDQHLNASGSVLQHTLSVVRTFGADRSVT
jgi:PAS domain-containing protein